MSDIGTSQSSIRYESAGDATDGRERHSLQAYVSDLLALERHIGQPLSGQLSSEATARYPESLLLIQTLKEQNEAHVDALQALLEELGGDAASPLKSAWASLLGGAAAVIGGARRTKVTKWLRDDYTALNLACMSYTLLHATAIGVGNAPIAALALQGLSDYASSVMQINAIIPEVVLRELQDDGETVMVGAADLIRRQTDMIWKDASRSIAF